MVGKSVTATSEEKLRMLRIKVCGCICCAIKHVADVQCEVHHVVEGNKRKGHRFTMGLCLWHHRGGPVEGYSRQRMIGWRGPSLAHGSRTFADEFGSQATLVAVQDYVLEKFEADHWLEFSMPRNIMLDVFYFWSHLQREEASR